RASCASSATSNFSTSDLCDSSSVKAARARGSSSTTRTRITTRTCARRAQLLRVFVRHRRQCGQRQGGDGKGAVLLQPEIQGGIVGVQVLEARSGIRDADPEARL